jgi:multidrug transporter EmrE-like cation transporter
MTLQLGILLALTCAVATNLGFLMKHRGAHEAPPVDMRHPLRSARDLFATKTFAIGMLIATGAWGFHVAALAMAPMSVVQAVLSGGVVLLAVMAERFFGCDVGPRQWWGVGLTAAGLVLLGVTLPASSHGAHSAYSVSAMIAFEGGLVGVGALLILGPRFGGAERHHGLMLGAASGVLFGVSDIAIKAITGLVGSAGIMAFATPWFAITLIASVVAFYASARGLQVGEAVPVITVTGAAANVSCIAGGIIVFGDPMPGNALGVAAQVIAFSMVCVAAYLAPAPLRAADGAGAVAPATA